MALSNPHAVASYGMQDGYVGGRQRGWGVPTTAQLSD